ncbi:MAG: hypothetical protein ACREBN_13090, partial [Burkholderiaceae bacterium]
EQGTHEELLRIGGHYAMLWKRQSGGFLANDVPDVIAEPDDDIVVEGATEVHPDGVEEPQVRF